MASIHEIKRRIKSVKNIAQVTRAMQMVAASRMRRAQEQALASRPYANKAWEILTHLSEQNVKHPLLTPRESAKNVALILITADKGLAGAYNANVIRAAVRFMRENDREDARLITVGRKGNEFMRRVGRDIRAEFTRFGDRPNLMDTLPISRIVIDDYCSGLVDIVYLVYAKFVTTMTQTPVMEQLLPVEPIELPVMQNVEYIYEPGSEEVLGELLPRFVEMEVYHAVLESIASEQSARMVAMRNATDSANELIGDLTLLYNKARQEAITKELLDITGGVAALT